MNDQASAQTSVQRLTVALDPVVRVVDDPLTQPERDRKYRPPLKGPSVLHTITKWPSLSVKSYSARKREPVAFTDVRDDPGQTLNILAAKHPGKPIGQ